MAARRFKSSLYVLGMFRGKPMGSGGRRPLESPCKNTACGYTKPMAGQSMQDPPWLLLAELDPPSPPSPARSAGFGAPPTDASCFELWERFDMLPHIRAHSLAVGRVATTLALWARQRGLDVDVQLVRASGLLHDIAKTYTIRHGGNHGQIGGAWMQEVIGNPLLAMGIVHHVHWPWALDVRAFFLPLVIIYSDKRVRHDAVVTLGERYEDLYARYGLTPLARDRITESRRQGDVLEKALSHLLGMELHEHSFDSGRLVERA